MTNTNTISEFVYFILNEDLMHMKIGYSKEPNNRLKTLQTATSSKLKLLFALGGSKKLETLLHKEFSLSNIRNEWFVCDDNFFHMLIKLLDNKLDHVIWYITSQELNTFFKVFLIQQEKQLKEALNKIANLESQLEEYKPKVVVVPKEAKCPL
jgi:hypothetical protein